MRLTIKDLQDMKARGEKIPMMTAYDYTSGKLLEQAGIPLMLVGDSLGMVVLGYDSTVPVTMDDMLHHIKTVVRGTEKAHIVGDLPFMSYHAEVSEASEPRAASSKRAGRSRSSWKAARRWPRR